MLSMLHQEFMPAARKFADDLTETIASRKALALGLSCKGEEKLLTQAVEQYEELFDLTEKLDKDALTAEQMGGDLLAQAVFYHDTILADMEAARKIADELEVIMPEEYIPYPTYTQILFYV